MAPSRCLPDPAVLDRLLAGAGVRAGRSVEVPSLDGDWVRFDDPPGVAGPPPSIVKPPVTSQPLAHGHSVAGAAPLGAAATFAAGAAQRSLPAAAPAPPPPTRSAPRATLPDFQLHDHREVKARPAAALPPAPPHSAAPVVAPSEPTDEQLGEDVFGPAAAALGVEQRLQKLVAWVMGATQAGSAFVADLEGLPLVNRNTPEPYIVAIGPLARAQREIARFVPESPPGTSIVELDHLHVLEVVWADTSIGRLGVGMVVTDPIKHSIVSRIRRLAALSVVSRGDT